MFRGGHGLYEHDPWVSSQLAISGSPAPVVKGTADLGGQSSGVHRDKLQQLAFGAAELSDLPGCYQRDTSVVAGLSPTEPLTTCFTCRSVGSLCVLLYLYHDPSEPRRSRSEAARVFTFRVRDEMVIPPLPLSSIESHGNFRAHIGYVAVECGDFVGHAFRTRSVHGPRRFNLVHSPTRRSPGKRLS